MSTVSTTAETDPSPKALRDEIISRLAALEEGVLFVPEKFFGRGSSVLAEFYGDSADLHVPVGGGLHVAIIHTRYLKRLPASSKVAEQWAGQNGREIHVNGARTAHAIGLAKWEPLDGMGYFWDGEETRFRMRNIPIFFQPAPLWMRNETKEGRLARSVSALPEKTALRDLVGYLTSRPDQVATAQNAIDYLNDAAKTVSSDPLAKTSGTGFVVFEHDPTRALGILESAIDIIGQRAAAS